MEHEKVADSHFFIYNDQLAAIKLLFISHFKNNGNIKPQPVSAYCIYAITITIAIAIANTIAIALSLVLCFSRLW